ncbi:MAG: hypothetical protein EX266_05270 [Rhodobacteraceae bacterium]|nr:MAG: hypothetical protein EX266_05270 [Paracoccaceae bacterium]
MATGRPLYPARDQSATLLFSACIAALSFAIFWSIGDVATDNAEHSETAVKIWAGDADWPPNFLYFALLGLLGKMVGDTGELVTSSCILLAFAVGAKAFLTYGLLGELAPGSQRATRAATALALLVCFPIPVAFLVGATLSYFLGNIPPNVWHNSTTIFLMPLALSAFVLQVRDFDEASTRRVPAIMVLIVIGIVVKPSFFFAYAPATLVWLAFASRQAGQLIKGSVPIIAGGVVTGVLYVLIYHLQQGSLHDQASGVSIGPFAVWSRVMPAAEIPLAIIASFLAPLTYIVLGFRPNRTTFVGYAALLMGFATLIFVFVVETGPRATHGNFFWQTVVCSYLLHTVLAADLLDKWSSGGNRGRILGCGAIFLAMAISGLIYLYRLIALDVFLPY